MKAALVAAFCVSASSARSEILRLNQIQVIGTHNSYHAGLTPGVAKLLQARKPQAFDDLGLSTRAAHRSSSTTVCGRSSSTSMATTRAAGSTVRLGRRSVQAALRLSIRVA